jgi:hypothetical protein
LNYYSKGGRKTRESLSFESQSKWIAFINVVRDFRTNFLKLILGGKEVMFFCEKVKKEDIEIHFLRKVKGTNFTKTKIFVYVYNVYYVMIIELVTTIAQNFR